MVTNFVLSFGTPFASIIYLIVFEAAGGTNANLSTVWRTVFGISIVPRKETDPDLGKSQLKHVSH